MLGTALRLAPLAPQVAFVDEPSLVALSRPDFPLATDDALDLVSLRAFAVQNRYPTDVPDAMLSEAAGMIDVAARALRTVERALSPQSGQG